MKPDHIILQSQILDEFKEDLDKYGEEGYKVVSMTPYVDPLNEQWYSAVMVKYSDHPKEINLRIFELIDKIDTTLTQIEINTQKLVQKNP